MKKANNLIISLILGIGVLGSPVAARAAGAAQIEQNVRAAARQLYANNPEARALAREAEAVLIFPDIVKAGFLFGGSFGEGELLEHWHISGFYATAAASYGFQAGVEKYGYALFFMDHEASSYLKRSRGWTIAAGPSVHNSEQGLHQTILHKRPSEGRLCRLLQSTRFNGRCRPPRLKDHADFSLSRLSP